MLPAPSRTHERPDWHALPTLRSRRAASVHTGRRPRRGGSAATNVCQENQRKEAEALFRPFQLRVLLHQLLQAEPRKLYRNLGFFTLSFPPVDGALAVFRMADLLTGAKAAPARGRLHWNLRHAEFLAARGEELGDVLDRVISSTRVSARLRFPRLIPAGVLILIFVGVMRIRWIG